MRPGSTNETGEFLKMCPAPGTCGVGLLDFSYYYYFSRRILARGVRGFILFLFYFFLLFCFVFRSWPHSSASFGEERKFHPQRWRRWADPSASRNVSLGSTRKNSARARRHEQQPTAAISLTPLEHLISRVLTGTSYKEDARAKENNLRARLLSLSPLATAHDSIAVAQSHWGVR